MTNQNQPIDQEIGSRVRYTITRETLAQFNGGGCRRCGCKDVREIQTNGEGGRMVKKICRFCGERRG